MPKRTIYIQNAADINIAQKSLVISQGQQIAKIPLEDIGVLILESHRARITSAALSTMAAASISVVTCGPDHMPNGHSSSRSTFEVCGNRRESTCHVQAFEKTALAPHRNSENS